VDRPSLEKHMLRKSGATISRNHERRISSWTDHVMKFKRLNGCKGLGSKTLREMYPRAKNLALRNCLRLVHLWCFYLRRHEIVQLQPVIEMWFDLQFVRLSYSRLGDECDEQRNHSVADQAPRRPNCRERTNRKSQNS
jgi:hypothetical protein